MHSMQSVDDALDDRTAGTRAQEEIQEEMLAIQMKGSIHI